MNFWKNYSNKRENRMKGIKKRFPLWRLNSLRISYLLNSRLIHLSPRFKCSKVEVGHLLEWEIWNQRCNKLKNVQTRKIKTQERIYTKEIHKSQLKIYIKGLLLSLELVIKTSISMLSLLNQLATFPPQRMKINIISKLPKQILLA